jgi:hypothetical protein
MFKDMNRWLRFALSGVIALVLLFALVFEISIPLPVFQEPAPVESVEPFAVRERISIDAGEDAYLHSGADLYVYSDDHSTQKVHIDGATGAIDMEGDLDIAGTASWGCSTATITQNLTLTGTVTAQTGTITGTLTAEQLTSTDDLGVTGTATLGDAAIGGGYGSTGCTISTAGVLQCNGAATVDGAITATGGVVGDVTGDVTGKVNGAYPLLYGTDGYALDVGTDTVTDTLTLSLSNVTTPTVGLCTLASDPASTGAFCTVAVSGVTATLKLWESDLTAGTVGADVHWAVIGQE